MGKFILPCDLAVSRGTLKHNHLRNAYLLLRPIQLASEITNGFYTHESTRKLYQEVLDGLGTGFSPALLVDELAPLRQLPQSLKETLSNSLNEIYNRQFRPEEREIELTVSGRRFFQALDAFLVFIKSGQELSAENEAYKYLCTAAQYLHDVLEKLPKGIWLP